MLRLVLRHRYARVLRLGERTSKRGEQVVRSASAPGVKGQSIWVVFFASSGRLHGSAEYVRDCGALVFDDLSAAASEEGDEEEDKSDHCYPTYDSTSDGPFVWLPGGRLCFWS